MQRQSCASQKEKTHTTTTKAKKQTNVQTDCMYKHMVFREENSSVSFITLLFAFFDTYNFLH